MLIRAMAGFCNSVADRSNNRIQIFDINGKFVDQWKNSGTPWGLGDLIYVVDGGNNRRDLCGRVSGINVKKFVSR